ncbi:hypothetical protein B0H14DRAFT_2558769 [Mycena olivaceomarginata]|nr:hypothetical protein B0H14DRAFT_2558769 [Mycena olivaceomarginata]
MSIALTFGDKKLVDTVLIGPEGAVYYTTTTTHGFRGRKITTITAASGQTGIINWREKVFILNGVQRQWDTIRSGGVWSKEKEWNWENRPFKLKYHHRNQELLVTPTVGGDAHTARFTVYHTHLLRESDRAVIYFPSQMEEGERMFLLMAILETEMHRQDVQNASNGAVAVAAA